jgi:UPF0755 protein
MRLFLSLVIFLGLAAGAIYAGLLWEDRHFAAAGPSATNHIVVVAPGEGLRGTADALAAVGIVDNALLFRAGAIRRGKAALLKAGEYDFPAHAAPADILAMLVAHKVLQHKLTVAEGLTSDMVLAALKAEPALTGDVTQVPEGSLLPETYLFERGTSRAAMLERMHRAQSALLAKLWPARKDGLPLAGEEDALKLASIVEKETARPAERPRIAAVFVNRLKSGMKLESDPTIIYGLTKGAPLGHELRESEIATPNPYSTYQNPGLPPTPICNPGKDAIAAVLMPADTDELFFVADGSGGHVFARTIAEHEKNVAAWRKHEQETAPAP